MNGDGEKDIRVLSTPDEPNSWPTPPIYESPWSIERIRKYFDEIGYVNTVLGMKDEYDLALSKALFTIWQLEGLLKGKE